VPIFESIEDHFELGMPARAVGLVGNQVLLRHVGDVRRILGLREDVIVGLVFGRSDLFGD
jgi:hypothetical protein